MIDKERFASLEEWYFGWYLDELMRAGYLVDYMYQGHTFNLTPQIHRRFIRQLKTKEKHIERELLKPLTYTPDFKIVWYPHALCTWFANWNIEYREIYKDSPFITNEVQIREGVVQVVSYIDVKPDLARKYAGRSVSLITFPIVQKMVMQQFNKYVQPIVPSKVFKATFTPNRYLHTDAKRMERTIHFEPKTLNEYVQRVRNQKSIF